jgi:hypothetical protein
MVLRLQKRMGISEWWMIKDADGNSCCERPSSIREYGVGFAHSILRYVESGSLLQSLLWRRCSSRQCKSSRHTPYSCKRELALRG